MEKKSSFGLEPSRLAHLLAVSAGAVEPRDDRTDDQTPEVLLRRYLSSCLSAEPSVIRHLASAMEQSEDRVQPPLARSFKEALLDPDCDVAILTAIKNHGKGLATTSVSGVESSVVTALYYAAIASALVHHAERITRYSRGTLAQRFVVFSQAAWMDEDLRKLFVLAAESCREDRTGG